MIDVMTFVQTPRCTIIIVVPLFTTFSGTEPVIKYTAAADGILAKQGSIKAKNVTPPSCDTVAQLIITETDLSDKFTPERGVGTLFGFGDAPAIFQRHFRYFYIVTSSYST